MEVATDAGVLVGAMGECGDNRDVAHALTQKTTPIIPKMDIALKGRVGLDIRIFITKLWFDFPTMKLYNRNVWTSLEMKSSI